MNPIIISPKRGQQQTTEERQTMCALQKNMTQQRLIGKHTKLSHQSLLIAKHTNVYTSIIVNPWDCGVCPSDGYLLSLSSARTGLQPYTYAPICGKSMRHYVEKMKIVSDDRGHAEVFLPTPAHREALCAESHWCRKIAPLWLARGWSTVSSGKERHPMSVQAARQPYLYRILYTIGSTVRRTIVYSVEYWKIQNGQQNRPESTFPTQNRPNSCRVQKSRWSYRIYNSLTSREDA